jgi:hypothetical protein
LHLVCSGREETMTTPRAATEEPPDAENRRAITFLAPLLLQGEPLHDARDDARAGTEAKKS